jgi:hypothetical protein
MNKLNKYWFKRKGKKGMMPITWEGWALFTVFIGTITQVYRFVNGIIPIFLVCIMIAVIYYRIGELKTNPVETFDKEKGRFGYKQLLGALAGMIMGLAVFFGIFLISINYQHSNAGSVVKLTNENGWMEFHAKDDTFTVEVPSYPKYSLTSQPVANTNVILKISTYESKISDAEDYLIVVTELPKEGNYSDASVVFSSAITSMKNNIQKQTNEEPIIKTSPIETFLSYPSQTFSIDGIKNDYKIAGTSFLTGKQMYLITYNSDKKNFNESNYLHFINSMKLLK